MGKSKKTTHDKSNNPRKTMKQRNGGMHRVLLPSARSLRSHIAPSVAPRFMLLGVNHQNRGSSNAASSFRRGPTPIDVKEAIDKFFTESTTKQIEYPIPPAFSQVLASRLAEINTLTDKELNNLIQKAKEEEARRSSSRSGTSTSTSTSVSSKEVMKQPVVPGITKGDIGKSTLTITSSMVLGPIHHIGFVAHTRTNLIFPLIDTICNKPLMLFHKTHQRFMIRKKIKKDIKNIVNKYFESTSEAYSSSESIVLEIQKIIVFFMIYKLIRCIFESKTAKEEETCRTKLSNFIRQMVREDKYDLVKQLYDIG